MKKIVCPVCGAKLKYWREDVFERTQEIKDSDSSFVNGSNSELYTGCPLLLVGRKCGCSSGSAYEQIKNAKELKSLIEGIDAMLGELQIVSEYERRKQLYNQKPK